MNPSIRRVLFFLFVTTFIVTASVLLIYANGYRYNAGRQGIEKTGQLLVETEPKGAQIYVNDVPVTKQWSSDLLTTPATVPYLFSGTYRLSVKRDGMYDWSDDITIYPGRTTIRSDIYLFKHAQPTLIGAVKNIRAVYLVNDGYVIDDGTHVYLASPRKEEVSSLYTSPDTIHDVLPAPSAARMVVRSGDGWQRIERGKSVWNVIENKKHPVTFRWAFDSDQLYMRDEKGIAHYDESKNMFVPLVLEKNILDFSVDEQLIVLEDGSRPSIQFFDPQSGAKVKEYQISQPMTRILGGSSQHFLVLGDGSGSLYLFDRTASRPVFQHISDATSISFTKPNHFFTANDFEIWSHDFVDDRYSRILVTRQSTPFTAVLPFKSLPFVVTVSGGKDIRIRDLRERTVPFELALSSFSSVNAVSFNQKETALIIVGTRSGVSGVYALPITEQEELFPLVK